MTKNKQISIWQYENNPNFLQRNDFHITADNEGKTHLISLLNKFHGKQGSMAIALATPPKRNRERRNVFHFSKWKLSVLDVKEYQFQVFGHTLATTIPKSDLEYFIDAALNLNSSCTSEDFAIGDKNGRVWFWNYRADKVKKKR